MAAVATHPNLLRKVVWTDDACEMRSAVSQAPGDGEVKIQVAASVVSAGTERAQFLELPNATVGRPFEPGYAVAGTVVAVGPGAPFRIGQHVAAHGPHASEAVVDAEAVFPVPDELPSAAAATAMLGVIAALGRRCGRMRRSDAVAVVGAGPVGLLAQRMCAADGGAPIAVISRSGAKERHICAGGARSLVVGRDDERIAALAAPLVIDATGDPGSLDVAATAAGPAGRVVLLGSPRGHARRLPAAVRERNLELIGAHCDNLTVDERAQLAQDYLGALAGGHLAIDDLLTDVVLPAEVPRFYGRLVESAEIVLAVIDWSAEHRA